MMTIFESRAEQSRAEQSRAEQSRARLIGLDLFRILLAFWVFIFHTFHVECTYGKFDGIVRMGAVAMTGFFMLSGLSMHYSYGRKDLLKLDNIKKYFITRAIAIFPLYYVVSALYILFMGKETLLQNLVLFPVELIGIQSMFSSLFDVTHNGGTWFISCILFCYLMYPFISEVIKQISYRSKIVLGSLCIGMLLYAPIVVHFFRLESIYSNPFFRILEFTVGILLCSVLEGITEKDRAKKVWGCFWMFYAEILVLVSGISILYALEIARGNYMLYSWIGIPMFTMLLTTSCFIDIKCQVLRRLIRYLSSISYGFFLAQFFTWPIVRRITPLFNNSNSAKIFISLIICILISIILHEIVEKPAKNKLLNLFYK